MSSNVCLPFKFTTCNTTARMAAEAEAEKAPLIAAMRSRFQRMWSPQHQHQQHHQQQQHHQTHRSAPRASASTPNSSAPAAAASSGGVSPAAAAPTTAPAAPPVETETGGGGGGAGGGAPDISATCKVCLDRPLEVLLMPCRHVALCRECAGDARLTRCPVCRGNINSKERVFV